MTTPLTPYPIIARNLAFKAGRKIIIKDITLVLEKNEFVGLIGGSGSGKTTLLTCLNGYRGLSEGTLRLNGIPSTDRDKLRDLIGYVPQEDIVHRTLRVERALHYAFLLRAGADVDNEKIDYAVNRVLYHLNLTEHKNKKITSLSGGQRKRVNIGVELLHSPPLFFLDEPTAGLDPGLERQLMRLLAKMAGQERVILLTTHLMQNVTLFDVLIFLHKGQMIYFGPSREITGFFQVNDMVDLFEKVMRSDPGNLYRDYLQSDICRRFLFPRLKASEHV